MSSLPFALLYRLLIETFHACSFASGVYVSILTNPIFEFGETDDVGRRVGMFMITLGLGALAGPPISGAILTASGGFKAVGYYAGELS
jgi:MFS transporter, MCT family, solute carrier family 16 (monocarboxylic acid transporters), member 10